MLDFFRRHQRYFFLITTIVIVISFSFFGTYSTLTDTSFREQIAFRNVNGSDVTRYELDEMVVFLGTDSLDKIYFGGAWGPNFLNDGVIRKDFFETGLGIQLANAYADDLRSDFAARLEKERRFNPYTNPQAKFIGVESAWNNFAPTMTSYYHVLKVAQDPLTDDALHARLSLFMLDRQFPPHLMRQVIRYQENQYKFVSPDRALDQIDLSLFGYHTVEDWFGPKFVRLIAEFIMNSAVIAEQKGYQVTKAEALADLIRNSEASYQQNVKNPNIGVTSSHEFFNEQLRRMGMDQNIAAKVWRQVMLFRRMFNDMGNSVFVDPYSIKQLDAYAMESVEGDLYRLPKELRMGSFRALQKLEAYLDAVSKRSDDDRAKLTLPTTYLPASEVAQKTPELVEKRYLLEVAQVDKKSLQSNIAIKDMWNWEVSDKGWDKIKKQFSDLGPAPGATRDERFASLDALDDKTRARVDGYARESIVDEHPEWLASALQEATSKRVAVGLHEKGGSKAFQSLENGRDLIVLLDAAPLASEDATKQKPAAKEAADKLAKYSPDKTNYYRIAVIDRVPQAELLSYADAESQGVLDKLLDAKLEAYYLKIREGSPKDFQREDGTWKTFAEARDLVAERYFDKVLKSIKTSYASVVSADKVPQNMIGDYAASLRFFSYVNDVKAKLQKDPTLAAQLTKPNDSKPQIERGAEGVATISSEFSGDKLVTKPKLADQWKLEKVSYHTLRSSGEQVLDKAVVFNMPAGSWTAVNTPANGDVNFFFIERKGTSISTEALNSGVKHVRDMLSDDAKRALMNHLLTAIKAKNAISLQYMNAAVE